MGLEDTVEAMLSEDYKERFKAEYQQLHIRTMSLARMLKSWDEGTLDFEPTCPQDLLLKQLGFMESYLFTLEQRAQIEGIDLNE